MKHQSRLVQKLQFAGGHPGNSALVAGGIFYGCHSKIRGEFQDNTWEHLLLIFLVSAPTALLIHY